MTEPARFGWTVLLPVKVLAQAKSRLAVLAGEHGGDGVGREGECEFPAAVTSEDGEP